MSSRPVVIFMTSNGVGMGHISRQLAIILDGRKVDPVLFSLSGALPRVIQAEATGELPEAHDSKIRYEYCPSREAVRLPLSPDSCHRGVSVRGDFEGVKDLVGGGGEGVGGGVFVAGDLDGDFLQGA